MRASPSFDHLRHDEEAVGGARGVGQDGLDLGPVGDDVVAQAQGLGHVGGHGLDARDIDLIELFDPGEDAVQLRGERLQPATSTWPDFAA